MGRARRARAWLRRLFEEPHGPGPRLADQGAERHAPPRVRLVLDGAGAARPRAHRRCLQSSADHPAGLSQNHHARAVAGSFRAYQAAHQLPRAAKDFQSIFYKFPLTDEAKAAGSALTPLMHALGREYPYPGVELQQQRAQAFYDAHKWREARSEFEKLLIQLKDPANPARQRAQLRIAQCRVQLKGSPSLIASLKT